MIATRANEQAAAPAAGAVRTIVGVRSCDCGIQGPENLILCLAGELKLLGVRYVIVNLWDGTPPVVALHQEAQRRGLESYLVATDSSLDPALLPRLAVALRRLRPDVIHTHDFKGEMAVLATRPLLHAPVVGSFYGRLAINSLYLKLEDWLRLIAFRFSAHVFANARAQQAELRRWLVPARRTSLLPSFVDTRALTPPSPAQRAAARARLGIAPDQPVLVTIARLSKNKGHAYMLAALPALLHAFPNLLYLVPGEGDSAWHGDGGFRAVLEAEAERLGIAGGVRFLGYYPQLGDLLAAADLLVSPSLREGMQVSLIEGMAAGLPVVATAVGGTPDAVADGVSGLLVPPADAGALERAVGALLRDPPRMRALGAAGRRRAEQLFDTRAVAAELLRVCEEVRQRAR